VLENPKRLEVIKMNRIKSLGFISALIVVAAAFLFIATPKSHAMAASYHSYSHTSSYSANHAYSSSYNYNLTSHTNIRNNRQTRIVWSNRNRPMIRVSGNRNFVMRNNRVQWQWNNANRRYQMVLPAMGLSENVVVTDSSYPNEQLNIEGSNLLNNYNYASMQQVNISVSDSVFQSLSQAISSLGAGNVNLSVNTTNGTISFNSINGIMTANYVSINVW
jgi:hypothetical protein